MRRIGAERVSEFDAAALKAEALKAEALKAEALKAEAPHGSRGSPADAKEKWLAP